MKWLAAALLDYRSRYEQAIRAAHARGIAERLERDFAWRPYPPTSELDFENRTYRVGEVAE